MKKGKYYAGKPLKDSPRGGQNPEAPAGGEAVTGKRKKVGFFPKKGDSKKLVINKILTIIALLVFLVCGGILLYEFVLQPMQTDQSNEKLQGLYYHEASSRETEEGEPAVSSEPEKDENGILLKFEDVRKINPDVVGWINIPNTIIDLPVVQSSEEDPEYYLNRDYEHNVTKSGSIFLDSRDSLEEPASKNLILYGHSLNSGRMFTDLLKYKQLDFYKNAPVFTFDTVYEESQWKIISVFITNTLESHGEVFDYLRVNFSSDEDYLNFVYQTRIRSLYNTGVSFNANDQIVMLSTCSYEYDNWREVVVARKVRPGESAEVDVSQVNWNPRTLYPDIWYTSRGGSKPAWPATYAEAKAQGLVTWTED